MSHLPTDLEQLCLSRSTVRVPVWAIPVLGPRQEQVPQRYGAAIRDYLPAMFSHETPVRVRYGETDRMGYAYYGDYAEYFEVGRVEALRSLGFPYRQLEDEGILLPVLELHVRYHRPARYDDRITVRTTIDAMPSARILFRYALFNEAGELLTEAETTLVFVDAESMRPRRAPQPLLDVLAPYFDP